MVVVGVGGHGDSGSVCVGEWGLREQARERICDSKRVRERRVVVVTGVVSGEDGDRHREQREREWLKWRGGREKGRSWYGEFVHGCAIRLGLDFDLYTGNAIMNMYSKLHSLGINGGSSSVADEVFDKSPESRKNDKNQSGFVDTNKLIGNKIDGNGEVLNVRGNSERKGPIASSLVDMYAKCGNIKIAKCIFNIMEQHDMVSWTAMIMGCALHGYAHEAISLFEQMEMEGVKPNSMAFIAVLTACSHAKLVDEAWKYFYRMIQDCGIAPSLEHYAAVADLLGRAGKLEKASAGKWKDAAKLRISTRDKGMRKKPACSWIEVKNKVHAFVAGDKSHPCYDRINEVLKVLLELMEWEGYVPDMNEVLHEVEEEEKRKLFCSHSERLAMAFGTISTAAGVTIRVTKLS
ncbi:Pentatricopeptide repeat-containing protein [Actinidia chinensis var. chinensis]|uniref:Pentatricopeptide repeat-containing protein n=1 Tax=Actinidia chinensis var. chinensis TaxID=1590841 RepID=A0A2R6QNR1_ACTCC|nr:Pentatricopeptide repeat-containing protein [Actinidia chinensis var. chinensis]